MSGFLMSEPTLSDTFGQHRFLRLGASPNHPGGLDLVSFWSLRMWETESFIFLMLLVGRFCVLRFIFLKNVFEKQNSLVTGFAISVPYRCHMHMAHKNPVFSLLYIPIYHMSYLFLLIKEKITRRRRDSGV